MDKKLSRQILYRPPSVQIPKKKEIKTEEAKPQTANPEVQKTKAVLNKPEKIAEWIASHPKFKWGTMCVELKIDKGNFQRMLKSKKISLPETKLLKIEKSLGDYGYL